MNVSRRSSLKAMAVLAAATPVARNAWGSAPPDPLSGRFLYEWVKAYDALGEHRTATVADAATSRWLARELAHAGLRVDTQVLQSDLFVPSDCFVEAGGKRIPAFPAWPPRATQAGGIAGALARADAADVSARIVFVDLASRKGASWALPGTTEAVRQVSARGAAAVVVCTEGPTGDVIAQNAEPVGLSWKIPVVLAGGRYAAALRQAAESGASAKLVLTGRYAPNASATNVIAMRPGKGGTVVVSTPKSGWFHCAGERGSGIAVFLALAHTLARETQAPLLFVATTGHEIGQTGAKLFLSTRAPQPGEVKFWLHIGADVAMRKIVFDGDVPRGLDAMSDSQGISVMPAQLPSARTAFAELPGYREPVTIDHAKAVGELGDFLAAGYDHIAGMVGTSPVFHTRLDRAPIATSPAILEAVARATRQFIHSTL